MNVEIVACLRDNYAYVIPTREGAYVVDPSEAAPVQAALGTRRLLGILCTHHHPDHVGGIAGLLQAFPETRVPVRVIGFEGDRTRIPEVTEPVRDGDVLALGELSVEVLHVPGHTLGAVTYVLSREGKPPAAFTGDTLFLGGCGRMFEGTAEQMWRSMQRLRSLSGDTQIYCGHEYTESNLRFAESLEPGRVAERSAREQKARAEGRPTVPGTIDAERRDNPFLRADDPGLRTALGVAPEMTDHEVFALIRSKKNVFA